MFTRILLSVTLLVGVLAVNPILDSSNGLQVRASTQPSLCGGGEVILTDDFTDSNSGWRVDAGAGFEWGYAEGEHEYKVFISSVSFVAWAEAPIDLESMPGSFCTAADIRHYVADELTDSGNIGLALFSHGDEVKYFFHVASSSGFYRLDRLDESGWTPIRDWTESDLINDVNEINRLAVRYFSGSTELFINGEVVATFNLPSIDNVGFIAGTFAEPNMNARFDNFVLVDLD